MDFLASYPVVTIAIIRLTYTWTLRLLSAFSIWYRQREPSNDRLSFYSESHLS